MKRDEGKDEDEGEVRMKRDEGMRRMKAKMKTSR